MQKVSTSKVPVQ